MSDQTLYRESLLELAFDNGHPADVIRWAGRDARDVSPGVMYGRALALFRTKDRDRALLHLRAALILHPSIAEGLLNDRGRRPEPAGNDEPFWGSPQETDGFLARFGKFWDKDALEWLRNTKAGLIPNSRAPPLLKGGALRPTQKNTTTSRLIGLIRNDPHITRHLLSQALGITEDGVKYHLKRLRMAGRIVHAGPDRGGQWEVIDGG